MLRKIQYKEEYLFQGLALSSLRGCQQRQIKCLWKIVWICKSRWKQNLHFGVDLFLLIADKTQSKIPYLEWDRGIDLEKKIKIT